jgi:branched-chain amino acid transport system permease protein
MDILLTNFILGVSFGCILFLLGTGLSLTLGLMKIINLSHGALYMLGAYVGLTAAKYTNDFVVGIFAGGIAAGLIGILQETAFLRQLYKRPSDQVLLTIGFVYILVNVVQWIWGPVPQSAFIPPILSGSIPMGKIDLPVFRIAIVGVGLLAALGLWFFQEKSKVGAIVRAGMDNKEMTMGLGINLSIVFTGVFALGSFIAGFCGLFGASSLGINLDIGWSALTLSMLVVIIGGAGSIQGALVGGLIIGIVDAYGKAFFPEFAYFTIYLVFIIVLLFRPNGLLGRTF